MLDRLRAFAFDLDQCSLASLSDALPGWDIDIIHGATLDSIALEWDPGMADLLVVSAGHDAAEVLGLCRFLSFCSVYSREAREAEAEFMGSRKDPQVLRPDAPVIVLVPPGRESLARAVMDAGAHSCLTLPINANLIVSVLDRARAGNQPDRHTLNLEGVHSQDQWRGDGVQRQHGF